VLDQASARIHLSFAKILSVCVFSRIRHCHSQAKRDSTRT
jgi:hypothetical protein